MGKTQPHQQHNGHHDPHTHCCSQTDASEPTNGKYDLVPPGFDGVAFTCPMHPGGARRPQ